MNSEIIPAAQIVPGSPIVLVHGAWHGAWCWSRVVDELARSSFDRGRVYTPTLRGLGERRDQLAPDVGLCAHVDDIVAVIERANMTDVVLVGHSYAGFVVREAADRVPDRIKGLALIDAWVGVDGESMAARAPEWFMPALVAAAEADGDGWAIPAPPPQFVGVNDDADVAWLTEMCTPQPLLSFTETTSLSGAVESIPTSAIVCRDGIGIPFREWAEGFGWPIATIDCGHDAMVIEPVRLARMIADIVAGLDGR